MSWFNESEKHQLNTHNTFTDEDDDVNDLIAANQVFIKDHGIINSKWN